MRDRLRRLGAAVGDVASGAGEAARGVGERVTDAGQAAVSAGGRLTGAVAGRIRGRGVDEPDDGADLLEPLDVPPDDELSALDEADAGDDAELGLGHFVQVLGNLERTPPLPLTEPFSSGLVPLLRRWGDAEPGSFLADGRVRRVLGFVGDRYVITVAPDGITVRGLIRRRHTPWERITMIGMVPRYEMLRDHVLEGAIDDMVAATGLRIPGLRWVIGKVVRTIEARLPDDQRAELEAVGGTALQHIERRGFDLELSGALALVSFLSQGLSTVVLDEARRRGVRVEGDETEAA